MNAMSLLEYMDYPLKSHAVYRLRGQFYLCICDGFHSWTWRLYALTPEGGYIEPANRATMAFELRTDGQWEQLTYSQAEHFWPGWSTVRVGVVPITLEELELVADRQEDLPITRAEDDAFRDLMAELEWEWL